MKAISLSLFMNKVMVGQKGFLKMVLFLIKPVRKTTIHMRPFGLVEEAVLLEEGCGLYWGDWMKNYLVPIIGKMLIYVIAP